MRILLVDDQRIFVHMIGALLRERGAEVIEASNGVEALEAERKEPPDCIISDILMPLMDGLTLCRECKTDDRLRNIPFLMATATFPEEDGLRISEDVGADGFLLKTQEPGTFMRQIDEAIQRCQSSKWRRPDADSVDENAAIHTFNEAIVRKILDKSAELESANRDLWIIKERFQMLSELCREGVVIDHDGTISSFGIPGKAVHGRATRRGGTTADRRERMRGSDIARKDSGNDACPHC
jgi:CheY-like chemotaxis protein